MVTIILPVGLQASADSGPLQTTNRFPLHMLVLTPRGAGAQMAHKGMLAATLATEYSNTYFDHRNDRWDILVDMEVWIAELSVVYGVTDRIALMVDIPMVSMHDGFLDGFLENYHNLLGVSNYDREDRPKDEFAYRVTKDGLTWVQGESEGFQPGDARVSAQFALPKISLAADRGFKWALVTTLKLPTGDADRGVGSGRYDIGLFVPINWSVERWLFYVTPGWIRIDDPETLGADISARDSVSLFAGAAFKWRDNWRLLAQLNYYSSPFEKTGLDELDTGGLELSLGFQHNLSPSHVLEFSFCEDITLAVPDFNVRLGITWRFGNGQQIAGMR